MVKRIDTSAYDAGRYSLSNGTGGINPLPADDEGLDALLLDQPEGDLDFDQTEYRGKPK